MYTNTPTPRTDAVSGKAGSYEEKYPQLEYLCRQLETELSVATIPICIGPPLIQILAKEGQWLSADGKHSLVAADGLFGKDPYEEIKELRGIAEDLRTRLEEAS